MIGSSVGWRERKSATEENYKSKLKNSLSIFFLEDNKRRKWKLKRKFKNFFFALWDWVKSRSLWCSLNIRENVEQRTLWGKICVQMKCYVVVIWDRYMGGIFEMRKDEKWKKKYLFTTSHTHNHQHMLLLVRVLDDEINSDTNQLRIETREKVSQ